ncbi:MAG TPA: nucleoside monophosphate kinase [Candidatus Nanoarchaeia archaeon]
MNILVFGAAGSGKSTHAKYITDKLGIPYIYTGDLFRELEKEDSERGEKIRQLMGQGVIIPNGISIPAFNEYLGKFDISKGVVLDGYPRNLDQAQSLPIPIDLITHITLPEDVAIARLKQRGRCDDTPGAIKKRLDLFKEQTKPIYEFYKNRGVEIVEIDNSPPVEVVRGSIDDILKDEGRDKVNT